MENQSNVPRAEKGKHVYFCALLGIVGGRFPVARSDQTENHGDAFIK